MRHGVRRAGWADEPVSRSLLLVCSGCAPRPPARHPRMRAPRCALWWLALAGLAGLGCVHSKKAAGSKRAQKAARSTDMPHIFTALPLFQRMRAQATGVVDQNGKSNQASDNFLTAEDVKAVRKDARALPPRPSAADLGDCDVPRVKDKVSQQDIPTSLLPASQPALSPRDHPPATGRPRVSAHRQPARR